MSIIDKLHTAFDCGYQMGHHDTVESQFNDTTDAADEFIEEYKEGGIETPCCWNAIDAANRVYLTDCGKKIIFKIGSSPQTQKYIFCCFCGELITTND